MSVPTTAIPTTNAQGRLISMDAYRGLVMVCLAADGFGLTPTAKRFPDSAIWQAIGYQFDHVQWVGCAFWDLIQPSFMFLVGVAVPFSFARREAETMSQSTLFRHVLTRSLILILLGIFLSSKGTPTTNFEFMNVLTQIGLGYPFLFLLRNRPFLVQTAAAVIILVGYWAWFAFTPVTPLDDLKDFNIPKNIPVLNGFERHWQKHTNPAAGFDRWFLNIFPPASALHPQRSSTATTTEQGNQEQRTESEPQPSTTFVEQTVNVLRRLVTRPEPFKFNRGGYQTLNFIPSYVTMLIGLMTGEFIRPAGAQRTKVFLILLAAGAILLSSGYIWQATGTCPLVKRIWTPSWGLFSTGWALLILASLYGIIDVLGFEAWSFPLVVAGRNSMVIYLASMLLRGWTSALLKRHVNDDLFNLFGTQFALIVEQTSLMVCFWLFAYWLYRQRIFVRI